MNLDLVGRPYDVRRARNDHHADYDVFGSNNMKGIAEVLRDFIKLSVHADVFYTALQFTFLYSALASRNTEVRASTKEGSEESDPERKEIEA